VLSKAMLLIEPRMESTFWAPSLILLEHTSLGPWHSGLVHQACQWMSQAILAPFAQHAAGNSCWWPFWSFRIAIVSMLMCSCHSKVPKWGRFGVRSWLQAVPYYHSNITTRRPIKKNDHIRPPHLMAWMGSEWKGLGFMNVRVNFYIEIEREAMVLANPVTHKFRVCRVCFRLSNKDERARESLC